MDKKNTKPSDMVLKGRTSSGFYYKIRYSRLNDFELLDIMSEVDDNPLLLPKVVTKLLGKEQKKRLYAHLRTPEGNVPVDKIELELKDIFKNPIIKK